MGNIRTEYIRGTAQVERFGDRVRKSRLRWFGDVQRRDSGQRMLPARRKKDTDEVPG